jgi:hypothetical protein
MFPCSRLGFLGICRIDDTGPSVPGKDRTDSLKLPGQDSNLDKENQNLLLPQRNSKRSNGLAERQREPLAFSSARESQECAAENPVGTPSTSPPAGPLPRKGYAGRGRAIE